MGCGQIKVIDDETFMKPFSIQLSSNQTSSISLEHANSIIDSIVNLHSRFISLFHNLVYKTGACVFKNPTIVHCTHCVFYLISSEMKGSLEESGLKYDEEPPYLSFDEDTLSKQTKDLANLLFDFIIEIRSYKALIKQIDKETPELQYLLHENKEMLTKENEDKILYSIDLFTNITKFRTNLLMLYKEEIYNYVTKSESYCKEINYIGKLAHDKGLLNVYKIAMLMKTFDRKLILERDEDQYSDSHYEMYNNEEDAKKEYLKKHGEIMFRMDVQLKGKKNNN